MSWLIFVPFLLAFSVSIPLACTCGKSWGRALPVPGIFLVGVLCLMLFLCLHYSIEFYLRIVALA